MFDWYRHLCWYDRRVLNLKLALGALALLVSSVAALIVR